MNDIEKVVAQMRQYGREEDIGTECRVSSHTIATWANTIEKSQVSELLSASKALVHASRCEHMIARLNDEEAAAYERIQKVVGSSR